MSADARGPGSPKNAARAQASFSIDLLCACTVDDLQAAVEAEWAKLASRRQIMVAERRSRALHRSLGDTPEVHPPGGSPRRPPGARVLKIRWGSSGEALLDSHLLQVTQRPNSWVSSFFACAFFARGFCVFSDRLLAIPDGHRRADRGLHRGDVRKYNKQSSSCL